MPYHLVEDTGESYYAAMKHLIQLFPVSSDAELRLRQLQWRL